MLSRELDWLIAVRGELAGGDANGLIVDCAVPLVGLLALVRVGVQWRLFCRLGVPGEDKGAMLVRVRGVTERLGVLDMARGAVLDEMKVRSGLGCSCY